MARSRIEKTTPAGGVSKQRKADLGPAAGTPASDVTQSFPVTGELGVSGARYSWGVVHEERLPKLTGIRVREVYRQMTDQDPVVGAAMMAIKQAMRGVDWRVEPEDVSSPAKSDAEFVEENMNDMSHTWQSFLTDALSMLTYGWALHEIVYKYRRGGEEEDDPAFRSRYGDGRIGWRKLALRAQMTLDKWEFDDHGGIKGMWQEDPNNPGKGLLFIPIRKAILFQTEPAAGNPEGKSILRNAFRPWYFKKFIEELEGIGIERDLAGLPMLKAPENVDIFAPQNASLLTKMKALVEDVRQDKTMGITLPHGFEFSLVTSSGAKQFDTGAVIARYDQRIAMSILAQFIILGSERVGSYALASQQKDLFTVSLEGWLQAIEQAINSFGIRRLMALNNLPTVPKLTHVPLIQPTLDEVSNFLRDVAGVGMITPDEDLEKWLRKRAALPLADPATAREIPGRQQGGGFGGEGEDEDEAAEATRKAEAWELLRKEAAARFDSMQDGLRPIQQVDRVLPFSEVHKRVADILDNPDEARRTTRRMRRHLESAFAVAVDKSAKRSRLNDLFNDESA